MFGYIYKTVNSINDKIYIGRHRWDGHSEDMEPILSDLGASKRILKEFEESHGFKLFPIDPNYIGSGKALLDDVEKYGRKNFYVMDILDIADTPQELKEKETEWITWYMRLGVPMYNVLDNGYFGRYREELSGESLAHYNEAYRRMGDASRFGDCKGENNGHYGHHHSTASKLKISRSLKGRVQSEEERKMRSKAHNHDFDPPNQRGKRVMHLKDSWTFVAPEDIQKYLDMGWTFGQGRIHINNGAINRLVSEEQFANMDKTIWKRGIYRGNK